MISVPKQPLEDAFLRVARAEEHIRDLDRRIADYIAAHGHLDFGQFDLEGHEERFKALQPFPAMFFILIGETIYNLRAALDYLVFTLAWLDSGKVQERTQFPIEDTPERFIARVHGKGAYLVGLNTCHIRMIEHLQPYRGCQWTSRLGGLSNPDKHRHLTPMGRALVYGPIVGTHTPEGAEQVDMKFDVTIRVAFDDFTPVVPTLEVLKARVAETLVDFKSAL